MNFTVSLATWFKIAKWATVDFPMLCAVAFVTVLGLLVIFFGKGH